MRWKLAAKLQQSQVQGGINTETGGDSHRIVLPGQSQARHQRNHHDQQTYLQESGRTFKQDDPLDDLVSARPWDQCNMATAATADQDAEIQNT